MKSRTPFESHPARLVRRLSRVAVAALALLGVALPVAADDERYLLDALVAELEAIEPGSDRTAHLPAILELDRDLAAELMGAVEVAGLGDALDAFLVGGGSIGFGAYDAYGIFDPFGEASPTSDAPPGETTGVFAFLRGASAGKDPFDVGLPGRPGSPLQPDLTQLGSGVALGGTYSRAYHVDGRRNVQVVYEKWVDDGGHVTRYEDTIRPDGGGSHVGIRTEGDRVTHYVLDKYDSEGRRVYGEEWTEDGTLTIFHDDPDDDAAPDILRIEGVDYAEISPDELSNPDAEEPLDLLPWLVEEPTPGEVLATWSTGVAEVFRTAESDDGLANPQPPLVTLFDVLSNPGYLDGLYIYDESGAPQGSGPALDNPHVHE